MPISLDKNTLASVVGGKITSEANFKAEGLAFGSADIKGGEIFIGLKGETTHGNKYVEDAFNRGASIFLVEEPFESSNPEINERAVRVGDSLRAFWEIAKWWRAQLTCPIIAITGSVGKTTTKEMLASLLLSQSVGYYGKKSFNNHVGVPFSLCQISRNHNWAVLELGTNHPGEIAPLAKLASPNVAAITRIAPAHIEFFGSVDSIAEEKLSISEGLGEKGILVLNGEDEVLRRVHANLGIQAATVWYGCSGSPELLITDRVDQDVIKQNFSIQYRGDKAEVLLSAFGEHSALNGGCAILSALSAFPDMRCEEAAKGLSKFKGAAMRQQWEEFQDGSVLIDDSYNSNPTSLAALFELGKELTRQGREVTLVIGDMLELGDKSHEFHVEAIKSAVEAGPKHLFTVGPKMLKAGEEVSGVEMGVEKVSQIIEVFGSRKFDCILVKGSRGIALDKLCEAIRAKN